MDKGDWRKEEGGEMGGNMRREGKEGDGKEKDFGLVPQRQRIHTTYHYHTSLNGLSQDQCASLFRTLDARQRLSVAHPLIPSPPVNYC